MTIAPSSATETQPPDAFVQMPPSQTDVIQRLRYMTDPLPHDVLVAGPIALTLYASIDQDDTNWIVILKDVGPDVSVLSVREGEREVPNDLPRARTHPRLAQGLAPGDRSNALKAVLAVASAHARGAEAGHAGRDRGISDRSDGDGESVSQGPPHLPRHHQPRSADRRRRRDQCGIRALPHLLEQNGAAQDLSRPPASVASAAAGHPGLSVILLESRT